MKNNYDPVWAEATRVAARRRRELAHQKSQKNAARKAKAARKAAGKTSKAACVKCGSPCRNIFCLPCAKKWWAEKQNAPASLDQEFRAIVQ